MPDLVKTDKMKPRAKLLPRAGFLLLVDFYLHFLDENILAGG